MKSCYVWQHGWPRGYYAKWNKWVRERKYWMISLICGIKETSNKQTKTTKQKWNHTSREQTGICQRGGVGMSRDVDEGD